MSESEPLLQFPCEFPIKIIGRAREDFIQLILDLVRPHFSAVTHESIQLRASNKQNYLGATLLVHAESQDQLDSIYMVLSEHADILMVL